MDLLIWRSLHAGVFSVLASDTHSAKLLRCAKVMIGYEKTPHSYC